METLAMNPFAVFTSITAPTILTNASSVVALGMPNRFARAVDRVRFVATELESHQLTSWEAPGCASSNWRSHAGGCGCSSVP